VRLIFAAACAVSASVAGIGYAARTGRISDWWDSSTYSSLQAYSQYENALGKLGVLNTSGEVLSKDHAFLTPLGTNGRACVTCHQPANAMSVSVDSLKARWKEVGA